MAAADRRRRAAEQRALDRQAEMQRLTGFFQRTGFDLTAWDTLTQLVRSASGKAIAYGEESRRYGNGLLVLARLRGTDGGFTLAAVVCPDPAALTRWPEKLDILVPDHTWLARLRAGGPEAGESPYWTPAPDAAPSNAFTQSWIRSRATGPARMSTPLFMPGRPTPMSRYLGCLVLRPEKDLGRHLTQVACRRPSGTSRRPPPSSPAMVMSGIAMPRSLMCCLPISFMPFLTFG
ncbi:hypothetical protein ACFW9I_31810 [[Kitasatospora] papulosa]|uniref:hypothetical protein n=1 Tax=[Kitasatospora] papulosa TaxID=1464011 RepID=UPI0036CACFCD